MTSAFRVGVLSIALMLGVGACASTGADNDDTSAQTDDVGADVQAANAENDAGGQVGDGAGVVAGEDTSTARANDGQASESKDKGGGGGQDTSGGGPVVADANVKPSTDAEASSSMGGWASGACTEPITGTGTKVGDIAYDFTQLDQYGQPLRLHDYCDKLVLLIGSAFW